MGDDGAEVDEAGVCALTGGFVTPEQGAGGLQVDLPFNRSNDGISTLVEWSTQTHHNLSSKLRRRQSDNNLAFDYSKYLIMLLCIWVRLYRVYNA